MLEDRGGGADRAGDRRAKELSSSRGDSLALPGSTNSHRRALKVDVHNLCSAKIVNQPGDGDSFARQEAPGLSASSDMRIYLHNAGNDLVLPGGAEESPLRGDSLAPPGSTELGLGALQLLGEGHCIVEMLISEPATQTIDMFEGGMHSEGAHHGFGICVPHRLKIARLDKGNRVDRTVGLREELYVLKRIALLSVHAIAF
eukprot:gene18438-biopygen5418